MSRDAHIARSKFTVENFPPRSSELSSDGYCPSSDEVVCMCKVLQKPIQFVTLKAEKHLFWAWISVDIDFCNFDR